MKLDRALVEAIVQLRPHPAFERVIQAIREDASEALAACGGADGTPLYRAQGKYQGLLAWVKAFDEARELSNNPHLK